MLIFTLQEIQHKLINGLGNLITALFYGICRNNLYQYRLSLKYLYTAVHIAWKLVFIFVYVEKKSPRLLNVWIRLLRMSKSGYRDISLSATGLKAYRTFNKNQVLISGKAIWIFTFFF